MSSAILASQPRSADSAPLDVYITCGLVLAGLVVMIYVGLRATRKAGWPDLGDLVTLITTSAAVAAGVRIGVVAATADKLVPFHSEDRYLLGFAGVALILASTKTMYGILREAATGNRAQ